MGQHRAQQHPALAGLLQTAPRALPWHLLCGCRWKQPGWLTFPGDPQPHGCLLEENQLMARKRMPVIIILITVTRLQEGADTGRHAARRQGTLG